ncbi:MAG: glucose-6-phosphate isomerase [Planctomycetes bacterium]|nr:glucose-6-phosphate isomerase [Planctomycetota bacterium]MCW8135019.1 glucose-6-phosphate isomerase [Planctomycetota bacterium]
MPTHTITLDTVGLLAAGEHGLSAADLAAVDARLPALRDRLQRERAAGQHGYLNLPGNSPLLESVLEACQPRLGRFRHLVVLGIGGSSLGLRALVNAMQPVAAPRVDLHIVDNTDPALFAQVIARVDLPQTQFVVVSKSGGTIETVLALGYFAEKLRHAGLSLVDHMVAVTDAVNGPLRRFAEQQGLDTCEIPPEVGGRFSVLTGAALVPATMMELDVATLMSGASRTEALCRSGDFAQDWPARLGLIAAELCRRGKSQLVFMPYSSRLRSVSDWFVQLWDESLGKDRDEQGRPAVSGQTAIPAAGATDQHAQLQLFLEGPNDKVLLFTRIEKHELDPPLGDFEWGDFDAAFVKGRTLGEVINAQHAGTAQACVERKRPNATLILPKLDASTLGELLMGLMSATTYAGFAFGVNPYDQPSVELGKKISRRMMGG